jgi:ABC-type lipoprotein export system ATPase subunit
MNITFDCVLPVPLADYSHHPESLWNNAHSIEKGENILINAASGKGKTTFTHILAGLRHDYSGKIRFDSTDISQFTIPEWLLVRQKKLSFVFQDLQLLPSLTCEENVLLNTNLKGGVTVDQLIEWAAHLGIDKKWKEKAGVISMGQQQRLAILRALSQPFEFVILDEPFSHLDEKNSQLAFELIEKRCAELSAGYIFTTLDPTDKIPFNKEIKL